MIYLFLVPVLLGRGLALATLGCIQQPATSSEGAFGIMPPVLPVVISMKLFRKKKPPSEEGGGFAAGEDGGRSLHRPGLHKNTFDTENRRFNSLRLN